jgi:hypothetical protein
MNGQTVVTVDGQKLGHVVADHDDCAVVEHGHLRKTQHAIPHQLLHEGGDEIRATVSKEVVESSPRAENGEFDRDAVLVHYGLIDPALADPMLLEENELDNAETAGLRAGIEPAPKERLEQRDPSRQEPKIVEKLPGGANDPSGTTSNYH